MYGLRFGPLAQDTVLCVVLGGIQVLLPGSYAELKLLHLGCTTAAGRRRWLYRIAHGLDTEPESRSLGIHNHCALGPVVW